MVLKNVIHYVYRNIFWPLVAAIVFTALLIYSRHVPPSMEAPVKGLSALITSLFALFGLKWDTSTKGADAKHLFHSRNVAILCAILAFNLALLYYEHSRRLTIYGVPGTAIYVDKDQYVGRILPPDASAGNLGIQPFRLPLRWGWRSIQLKDNPLSPETIEEFREEIRLPMPTDLLKELWSAVSRPKSESRNENLGKPESNTYGQGLYDREIHSRMMIAPLINFLDTSQDSASTSNPAASESADPARFLTCQILSQKLNEYWNQSLGEESASQTTRRLEMNPEMPALLVMRIAPVQPEPSAVVIHILPQGRKSGAPLLTVTMPTRPFNEAINSETETGTLRNAVEGFIAALPEALSRRIADEDLVTWYGAFFERIEPEIKANIHTELVNAAIRRTSAAITAAKSQPNIDYQTAAEVARSLQALPEASARLEAPLPEVDLAALAPTPVGTPPPAEQTRRTSAAQIAQKQAVEYVQDRPAQVAKALAEELPTAPRSPTSRVFLHCVGEGQREHLAAIQEVLESAKKPATVLGIENIEGKAKIPARFEIRYFVNDATTKQRAERLLKTIKDSGKLKNSDTARTLFVFPSEFERRNTADLSSRFEIWPAADSF